jgi:RNA polymerase sigma factor (TIGR02999 family)
MKAIFATGSDHSGRIGAMVHTPARVPGPITLLLQRSAEGDASAREAVWSMTHNELKALARSRLAQESGSPTWQPTELVNEVWLKLCNLHMDLRNRTHFLAMAATAMRRVLIDHARERRREKRGSGIEAVTLSSSINAAGAALTVDILDLNRALDELAELDLRKARAIELSYFGGMTDAELAEQLGVAEATVKRDLRSARAWLSSALESSA